MQSAELEETAEALGDDDFAAASGISIGSTINGSITETARTRLYRFSLASSGRVTLDMTSYMQYYCIFIYGSDGTEIWNTCGNEWNSNLKYRRDTHEIDLTNGTYYMKITGYYNENEYTSSTGTYALGTKFVSASESCAEPNDDFGKASAIGTTGTVRGQIAENDRYDIYRFSLARAGRITLTMTSYMKYYTAHVYSSDGEEIWYTDWNEWNENLKYCMDTYDLDLAAGNYYLKVTGYRNSDYSASTGNYTMSLKYTDAQVNYREPNNDFSTAYALRTDTTVKGQIALNDRYDVLKFSLPASKDIKISMTSYMKYYMLVLYNSAGTEIWKTYDNEWNENVGYRKDTHTLTLSAGSYYLKVSGYKYYWDADYYASTGTYSLSVNTKASVADAVINAISSRTYTGKAIKPSVTVTYNGKKLQKGRDYTVAYKNNTAIGKATVIITGKGSYTGTKKLTFKIVPRKVKLISAKTAGNGRQP